MNALILGATAPDIATFVVGAILVLGGALGVISLRNPVHAALSLVVTLFGIAVLFVAQEAHFLAAVQIIVYAGAIVVLFLFVIMLLGVDRTEVATGVKLRVQKPLAFVFAFAIVGLVLAIANLTWDATGARSQGGVLSGPGANVEKIADSIFTQYLFPFEATSVLLVIAVVGAVFLSRSAKAEESDEETVGSTPDDIAVEEEEVTK